MEHRPIRLGVNIDHVATIRQARRALEPDPTAAAVLAFLGGADGITIHLREDRRHIQDRDLRLLRETCPRGLNLEMAAVGSIIDIACAVKPDQVTLVPERREELTTEGGLDVVTHQGAVGAAMERLTKDGIAVALAEAKTPDDRDRELVTLATATEFLRSHNLHVHMGHGLDYWNVQAVARIPGVEELNIGHSIVSRAVLVGMKRAVREMKEAIRNA
jgi:pyridoxine 5-phosphate synthase